MGRTEIKKKAWEMIKGNKWYILKPLLLFDIILIALFFIVTLILGLTNGNTEVMNIYLDGVNITSFITCILVIIYTISYAQYILDFVRGDKYSFIKSISKVKSKILLFFVVSLIIGLMIALGTVLLVIPGIIVSLGHMFYQYVFVDNKEDRIGNIIKKSWDVTNGHKSELFVLGLSFIGWILLSTLTCGILYIWVIPYMTITFALTYEELKK